MVCLKEKTLILLPFAAHLLYIHNHDAVVHTENDDDVGKLLIDPLVMVLIPASRLLIPLAIRLSLSPSEMRYHFPQLPMTHPHLFSPWDT